MAGANGAMLGAAKTKIVMEDETEAAPDWAPAPAPGTLNAEIRLSDNPGLASPPAFSEQEGRHGHRTGRVPRDARGHHHQLECPGAGGAAGRLCYRRALPRRYDRAERDGHSRFEGLGNAEVEGPTDC